MEDGWEGNPAKLSRATVFTSSEDWRQAMIAHLWSDGTDHLLIDPASCIDDSGNVECTKYNDFDHLQWLGNKSGTTPLFNADHDNTWFCVEHHVRLNDPGQSNGLQEFWINDSLEARRENLNFTGTYTEYAINAVFFENYWNDGSIRDQRRYFDNIVISTERIGCLDSSVGIEVNDNKTVYEKKLFVNLLPASNKIMINYRAKGIRRNRLTITIFTVTGVKCKSYVTDAKSVENGFIINTEGYANGMFLLVVRTGNVRLKVPFIKAF